MALYVSGEGKLMYKTYYSGDRIVRNINISRYADKTLYVGCQRLYWIDEDKLYKLMGGRTTIELQNEGLVGTRQFIVLTLTGLVAITADYTIRVFDLEKNIFQDYGQPNPNLKMMELFRYRLIRPDQVFAFSRQKYDFSEYSGQNLLLSNCFDGNEVSEEKSHPINEYIAAKYNPIGIIDRNEQYVLRQKNGKLSIQGYDRTDIEYEIPDDSQLYNPAIQTKSARKV